MGGIEALGAVAGKLSPNRSNRRYANASFLVPYHAPGPTNMIVGHDKRELLRTNLRIGVVDRAPLPLHRKFNVLRLQFAPALDFGLVAVRREAFEIFGGQLSSGRALSGEFLSDERVLWQGLCRPFPPAKGHSLYGHPLLALFQNVR
jgi:hypothetical protein